jgi:hypothetical protein
MLYVFFWVIPRRLNFICRRFGTLCPIFIGKCSETSAYKIQTPGNYPEENVQHTEHGESLKSITVTMPKIKMGLSPVNTKNIKINK